MTAMTIKDTLPDGRKMRQVRNLYTQKGMFGLRSNEQYKPLTEKVMSVDDHMKSISSGAFKAINVQVNWWRSDEYGFYRERGDANKPLSLGNKLVYVEQGVTHILEIPDVPVSMGPHRAGPETVGLRQVAGMGIIKLEKLRLTQIDEKQDMVSVTPDFDPATDVRVATISPELYMTLSKHWPVRPRDKMFEIGSTGYHGSLTLFGIDDLYIYYDSGKIYACVAWSRYSSLGVVELNAPAAAGKSAHSGRVEQPVPC